MTSVFDAPSSFFLGDYDTWIGLLELIFDTLWPFAVSFPCLKKIL